MQGDYFLGLGVTYHDPALAIVDDDGSVLFAEATERFLQYKRALNSEPDNLYLLPDLLKRYCQEPRSITIATNWKRQRPWYERAMNAMGVLSTAGIHRRGLKTLNTPLSNEQIHHMMACNRNSIRQAGLNAVGIIRRHCPGTAIHFTDFAHHDSHAALACYGSGYADALCAVVDSYGERGSMAFYRWSEGRMTLLHEAIGLGSIGLFYMKMTELCGFDWMKGEEWKVMGLAAYGRCDDELLRLMEGTLTVRDMAAVHPGATLRASLEAMAAWRQARQHSLESAAALAATAQCWFERQMQRILTALHHRGGSDHLVLSGGCALNSACNGRLLANTPFRSLYVPPAPADDGTALGAAWLAWQQRHPEKRLGAESLPLSPYLGSSLKPETLKHLLSFAQGLRIWHLPDTLCEETASRIAAGKLVAWVQGRAEFGPRALGNRSILADPRDPRMKDTINARVKFREEYRPFAPAILDEYGDEYFEDYQYTPYMERALMFRSEVMARVPAVVHADGSGRLQSVRADWNPRYHGLISAFHRMTGVPVVLNTSFNIMGKPMVHTVEDALGVFLTSGLDVLVMEDYLVEKPAP
ncbi:MAG: hypothetical protein RIQ52_336 [Pseudomonadota bacterium]|jgi:carbamoyltransferase